MLVERVPASSSRSSGSRFHCEEIDSSSSDYDPLSLTLSLSSLSSSSSISTGTATKKQRQYYHPTNHHAGMAVFVCVTILTIVCTWWSTHVWNENVVSYYDYSTSSSSSSETMMRSRGGSRNITSSNNQIIHDTIDDDDDGLRSFSETTTQQGKEEDEQEQHDEVVQNHAYYPTTTYTNTTSRSSSTIVAIEEDKAETNSSSTTISSSSASDNEATKDDYEEVELNSSSNKPNDNSFHFCGKSQVYAMGVGRVEGMRPDHSLSLLYQCSGPSYDQFATKLHHLATNLSSSFHGQQQEQAILEEESTTPEAFTTTTTGSSWGVRDYPLPDNITVLALGNSHLRQISKTIACQYAHVLKEVQFLHGVVQQPRQQQQQDNETITMPSSDSFVLIFDNNSRWISITNTVLVYSTDWIKLIEEYFLRAVGTVTSSTVVGNDNVDNHHNDAMLSSSSSQLTFKNVDAIVLGKFTTHEEAEGTNFERTMLQEEQIYHEQQQQQRHTNDDAVDNEQLQLLLEKPSSTSTIMNVTTTHDCHESTTRTTTSAKYDHHIHRPNIVVDFSSISPPDLLDVARSYSGPIISVSMFSKSDVSRAETSYARYRHEHNNNENNNNNNNNNNNRDDDDCYKQDVQQEPQQQDHHQSNMTSNNGNTTAYTKTINNCTRKDNNSPASSVENTGRINENSMNATGGAGAAVYRVDARKYINMLGLECGSDDKNLVGTCHEPTSGLDDKTVKATTSHDEDEQSGSIDDIDDDSNNNENSRSRLLRQSIEKDSKSFTTASLSAATDNVFPGGISRNNSPSRPGRRNNLRKRRSRVLLSTYYQKQASRRQLTFGYRDPSDMHRCAGQWGGHADLVAWDVIEGLYYYYK